MITIPVKNSVAIYHTLMQPLLHQYGLRQQVRTDHGTEFALIGSDCTAVSSTTSTMARSFPCPAEHITPNHRVERMWPEVNQQINYPVKRILVQMEGSDELDMTNSITKFRVS